MILTDESIVSALMETATISAAAKRLCVSRSTVSKRMQDPDIQKLWREARTAALEASTAALQGATGQAVETARQTLTDPETSTQVRLNAAQLVLSNALRFTEQTDVLRRLDALERAQNE